MTDFKVMEIKVVVKKPWTGNNKQRVTARKQPLALLLTHRTRKLPLFPPARDSGINLGLFHRIVLRIRRRKEKLYRRYLLTASSEKHNHVLTASLRIKLRKWKENDRNLTCSLHHLVFSCSPIRSHFI